MRELIIYVSENGENEIVFKVNFYVPAYFFNISRILWF